MTTSTDFESQLDDNPADWTLRSIYADWLEEQGSPRAESMRWMVANRKRPWRQGSWSWCRSPHENILSGFGTELCLQLVNWEREREIGFGCAYYLTRIAAEIDLHNALVKAGEITCALIEEVEA